MLWKFRIKNRILKTAGGYTVSPAEECGDHHFKYEITAFLVMRKVFYCPSLIRYHIFGGEIHGK